MAKFGFDENELSQLFADAGAAVKKARTEAAPPEPAPEPEESGIQTLSEPVAGTAENLPGMPPEAQPVKAPVRPAASGKVYQVVSGIFDNDGIIFEGSEGPLGKVPFSAINALVLGRIEANSEQVVAFMAGGNVLFVSDKNVNMKNMIPAAGFSATQNWRAFIKLLGDRTYQTRDRGIVALNTGGLIPKYPSREALFEHLKGVGQ